jgi:hypothetical protein
MPGGWIAVFILCVLLGHSEKRHLSYMSASYRSRLFVSLRTSWRGMSITP